MYPWEKCRMPTGEHGLHRSWSPWGSFYFSTWKRCNFGDRPVSGFAVCESKTLFTAPPYFCQRWSLVCDLGQTAQDIVQRRLAQPASKWLPMQKKHNQHQHPPHHHHHDLAHVLQGKLQSLDLGASICQARSSPPVYNHAGSLIIIIIIIIIIFRRGVISNSMILWLFEYP